VESEPQPVDAITISAASVMTSVFMSKLSPDRFKERFKSTARIEISVCIVGGPNSKLADQYKNGVTAPPLDFFGWPTALSWAGTSTCTPRGNPT
jgi:hypothetical protein